MSPKKLVALREWLVTEGAQLGDQTLEIKHADDGVCVRACVCVREWAHAPTHPHTLTEVSRGVFCSTPIPAHSQIISIPVACIITEDMGRATELGRAILASNMLSRYFRLFLSLLLPIPHALSPPQQAKPVNLNSPSLSLSTTTQPRFEAPRHLFLAIFLCVDRKRGATSLFAPYHEILATMTLRNLVTRSPVWEWIGCGRPSLLP